MNRLYVLQSGFVTRNTGSLIRTPESEAMPLDTLLTVNLQTSDTDNYYDEAIESLFQQWRKDNELLKRFEFRELVLKAALRVFHHGDSIDKWLFDQITQPEVGYLHRKFLKETLASVLCNLPRSMETYTYYQLLRPASPGNRPQSGTDKPEESLHAYIKEGHSTRVVDILENWTKDLNGFADLLLCLHVVFGRRSAYIRPPQSH